MSVILQHHLGSSDINMNIQCRSSIIIINYRQQNRRMDGAKDFLVQLCSWRLKIDCALLLGASKWSFAWSLGEVQIRV